VNTTEMFIEYFFHINACEVRLSIFTQLDKRLPLKYHYHILSIKQIPKLALGSSVQRILTRSLHSCTAWKIMNPLNWSSVKILF